MSEYGLILAFPDQSDSFCHGWEMGALDARLACEIAPFELTLHEANTECITRVCQARGWRAEIKPTEVDGWIQCDFQRGLRPILRAV